MLAKMMLCTTLTCAAEAADDRVAEAQQPVHDAAGVHELGGQHEQRHRQQQEARVHAVEQLLGRGAHVEAREGQIEDRAADHRVADRQPQQAQRDDGVDRPREGARRVHSP